MASTGGAVTRHFTASKASVCSFDRVHSAYFAIGLLVGSIKFQYAWKKSGNVVHHLIPWEVTFQRWLWPYQGEWVLWWWAWDLRRSVVLCLILASACRCRCLCASLEQPLQPQPPVMFFLGHVISSTIHKYVICGRWRLLGHQVLLGIASEKSAHSQTKW